MQRDESTAGWAPVETTEAVAVAMALATAFWMSSALAMDRAWALLLVAWITRTLY